MKKHKGQMLTHALRDGILVSIKEVDNGLACGCVCPNPYCNVYLVARNNPENDKVAHFAHHQATECKGALESALHLLAKKVISKTKTIRTPNYYIDYDRKNNPSPYKIGQEIIFDEVLIENTVTPNTHTYIVPDVIGIKNGRKLYIEFAKTHFVDNGKKKKLKQLGIPCVEIDIRKLELDENAISDFLISDTPLSYWLINSKFDAEYNRHLEAIKRKQAEDEERWITEKKMEFEMNRQRLERHKNERNNKILKERRGYVQLCPIKAIAANKMKQTNFYNNPVLKRIIDGEYWNNEIYPGYGNEASIYLNNEKIIIYPNMKEREAQNEAEKKLSAFLYKGLKEIEKNISTPSTVDCHRCNYSVDYIELEKDSFRICKHP